MSMVSLIAPCSSTTAAVMRSTTVVTDLTDRSDGD
jgi:hypothetical protein